MTTSVKTRRFGDTLFLRLFLLMWVALVASHLLAYGVVMQLHAPPRDAARGGGSPPMPVLPSLPPMGQPPDQRMQRDGPPPPPPDEMRPHEPPMADGGAARGGLPSAALWLDYAVRFFAIGVAAWFGARWLSAPMRRLTGASEQLGAAIVDGQPAPVLDEQRGTLEVRQTARVFNAMAQRLRVQFDAQWLLMAAISHDLRTPLARLRLRLETMDAQALDEAPRGGTGTAGTQRQRCVADVREMDTLIGDVLAMLREGHERGERERIDAAALVQALVDDLTDQGQAATLVGEPAEAVVLAQATALKRIVGNLIGNALRYGGAAEVSVTREARELHIAVADRGPGIAPDQLDAVLQPYYRLDATRQHGTGLGLYIARDLAQRNGGRLSLANRPGGGLQATLSLPLA